MRQLTLAAPSVWQRTTLVFQQSRWFLIAFGMFYNIAQGRAPNEPPALSSSLSVLPLQRATLLATRLCFVSTRRPMLQPRPQYRSAHPTNARLQPPTRTL
jgi:hypothetical protein